MSNSLEEQHPKASHLVPLFAVFIITLAIAVSLHTARPVLKPVRGREALPPVPSLSAEAYMVRLAGERTILARQREWKKMAPASLTKILTAILAEEELPANATITFSPEAKNTEEKRSPAKAEEVFLRDEILKFALIASANDAALVLADAVGRKMGARNFTDAVTRFGELMNKKALALGMSDSQFQNPNGLDEDGQYTSAADLTLLSEYAWYHHPEIWRISRSIDDTVVSSNHTVYQIRTTDDLLKEFPALQGGKTGFTDNAQGNLLLLYPVRPDSPPHSCISDEGTTLYQGKNMPLTQDRTYTGYECGGKIAIIVILHSRDRFGDGRKVIQWLELINQT